MHDEEEVLSQIKQKFKEANIKTEIVERYGEEAIGEGRMRWLSAVYDVNEGPLLVGSLKLTKKIIDQIQVFSRIVPSDVGAFRWYDAHFCVLGNVKGKNKELTATIEESSWMEKFKAIVRSKVEVQKSRWVGGKLAELLNKDDDLKSTLDKYGLWTFYGDQHRTLNVRVRPDEKYSCVRVIFRMDRNKSKSPELIASRILESLDLAQKIAEHIHEIID